MLDIILGLIFGYAAMTRSNIIFMPIIVALAYLLMKKSWKQVIIGFSVVFLVMQLVNLPWVIRNYKTFGVPVVYTANSHFIYCGLISGRPDGYYHGTPKELEGLVGGERQKKASSLIAKELTSRPLHYAWLGIRRVSLFALPGTYGRCWPIWFQYYPGHCKTPLPYAQKFLFYGTAMMCYLFLFILSLGSIIFLSKEWGRLPLHKQINILVVLACIVFWLLEHMIIFPEKKHRYPLEPLMMLYAAYFLEQTWIS